MTAQLESASDGGVLDGMLQTIVIEGLPTVKYSGLFGGLAGIPSQKLTRNLSNLEADLIAAKEMILSQEEEVLTLATSTKSLFDL